MAEAASDGAARFSCPPNFAATPPASELPRVSLEALADPDTELWLIRAPADFAPDCLNGRVVPLSGSQIVKGKLAGKRRRYRVLSCRDPQAVEATLLAPSAKTDGGLTCAPTPQGSIRIFEGLQESLPGTPLQPIPSSPPPQIPPGLRPRFAAFGGSLPVTGPGAALALKTPATGKKKKRRQLLDASVPQEAVNGHGTLEVDTALGSPEMHVGKKKKKKQQQEVAVMGLLAKEPEADTPEALGAPLPSTTKKQKRQLREAEAVKLETGMAEPEAEMVKPELTEPLEEMVLPAAKTRQKGTAGVGPVQAGTAEPRPQVGVELQGEAMLSPSTKKRKKAKGQLVRPEAGIETGKPETRCLELRGEPMGPELPVPGEPLTVAAEASAKKRRKKDNGLIVMTEPCDEVTEPERPADTQPQAAPASTKKKKERRQKVTEAGTERADVPGALAEPALPGPGESEAQVTAASATKRRKLQRDQEGGRPGTGPQEEMPESNWEPGEVATGGRERKRKKDLQQDPV
ncbi:DNA-directed RNA polymerase I subunit RPA34 [Orycteropus afer afer]|uniref:DNA-directed RNA polymerase I subunit RPA34 n=1 Tax=Orycteropus afer afer TaxID=1230840 RepID=A0A8B7A523_ORYAF|nr:DNA-directed RNA polymerase I subunit RPA34 [Orycteropus afer afer]